MDGSAVHVLKEWNMTGKKKNNKRKRSKSKQHQGNKGTKEKNDRIEKVSLEPQGIYGCHLNGCDKDNFSSDSANEKSEVIPHEDKSCGFKEMVQAHPEITEKNLEHKRISVDLNVKPISGTEQRDTFQSSIQPQCNGGRQKSKTSTVKSSIPAAHLETKPDDSIKKRGPNIEKSVKDLQRCTVSLTRYRMMIKEEVDNSVKKIKAAFAELHSCIIDREVSLMAEVDKVKEEAMEILTARQKRAEELKRLTDLASQMAETQLAELRAEIKHFVSERKYDEELGRSARFSCDTEQLKTQIQLCGEISHPKNSYSSRTPCSSLLLSVTSHMATGKQSTHFRKSASHIKNVDSKTPSSKIPSHLISSPVESSPQVTPTNKQNGSSSQRRRFNSQYHGIRLNGSVKSQGASNETDQNNIKSSSRYEHRRQQHNSFRPKNKGALKNQDQSTTSRTTENVTHTEKTPKKHRTPDSTDPRPFRSSVARVSQCNLCPARIEGSGDATVLSVPAVTLVA
uniref:Spermatogenesis associated serine rich 2 like n=1 Tax=Pelusios castaneus TaxID=367368 RepID=A0A8C8RR05_9SAUR